MSLIFPTPWAVLGDKKTIPVTKQTSGRVSFEEGFGVDYQKNLSTDPDAKNIDREQLNYILNLLCEAINNVNIKAERALLLGVPIPWPLATVPEGCLKCNGSKFDPEIYVDLAKVYTNGETPDLRAYVIRGWDDGRGIDLNRVLLSSQEDAIRNITGNVANIFTNAPTVFNGALSFGGSGYGEWQPGSGLQLQFRNLSFSAAKTVPTASENRMKNIAFNYIMRAV